MELGLCGQYSDHATNWEKQGSECGRGRRISPRTCSRAPMSSYSKDIRAYFPKIRRLRRETASYHDSNRLWNPSCIVNLKFVLCLTKQYGLISQEFYLSFWVKMQDLIKILRCCNFLQIYTIFNVPDLNYKTQSTHLIGIS